MLTTGATTAQTLTSGALDVAATPSVTFRVRVTDVHGNQVTQQQVSVALVDVDEAPALTTAALLVPENQQAAGMLVVADQEAVPSIVFSLLPDALDSAFFTLDTATGALAFVAAGGVDFEAEASYAVRVRVADAGNPAPGTVADVTVSLNDLAEWPAPTEGPDLLGGSNNGATIHGLAGTDSMNASSGADTINTCNDGVLDVLVDRSAAEGNDRIIGFVSGQDQVHLSRLGFGLEEDFLLSSASFVRTTGQLSFDTNGAESGECSTSPASTPACRSCRISSSWRERRGGRGHVRVVAPRRPRGSWCGAP